MIRTKKYESDICEFIYLFRFKESPILNLIAITIRNNICLLCEKYSKIWEK